MAEAQDAASGAAGGAAAGGAIGPWGAAIGAGVGALYGLAKGSQTGHGRFFSVTGSGAPPSQWGALQKQQEAMDAYRNGTGPNPDNAAYANDLIKQLAGGAQGRTAPQITGAQFTVDPTARQGLLDTAQRLGGIASGQQMGAGELAVNRQIGQATAQQMAAARMAHGANAALALRQMMRSNADLRLAGAGQAAQSRMQDQQGANAQLSSLFGNLYGQDAAAAAQNAQFGQQAQLANQQAALQQRGMNDALQMQALGQMLGWDQQTINAHLAAIQQQRANAEGPNFTASLLQGGGQLLPLLAQLWKQGQGGAPAVPNSGAPAGDPSALGA